MSSSPIRFRKSHLDRSLMLTSVDLEPHFTREGFVVKPSQVVHRPEQELAADPAVFLPQPELGLGPQEVLRACRPRPQPAVDHSPHDRVGVEVPVGHQGRHLGEAEERRPQPPRHLAERRVVAETDAPIADPAGRVVVPAERPQVVHLVEGVEVGHLELGRHVEPVEVPPQARVAAADAAAEEVELLVAVEGALGHVDDGLDLLAEAARHQGFDGVDTPVVAGDGVALFVHLSARAYRDDDVGAGSRPDDLRLVVDQIDRVVADDSPVDIGLLGLRVVVGLEEGRSR